MVQTVLVCVEELATRIRVPFSTPYDQFHTYSTHAQVAISLSISGPTWRERLASDRARSRRSATTATAHTRVELIAYMRIQPLSMHNGSHSGAHEHPHDRSIMHRQHSHPRPLRTRKRAEAKPSNGYEHSSGHSNGCHCAEAQTTLQLAAVLLQPPSAAKAAEHLCRARASGCQLEGRARGEFEIA